MYKILLISILQIYIVNNSAYSECALCEEIKEKNRNLPPLKHIYYEDYLEDLKTEGNSAVGKIDFEENVNEVKTENDRNKDH